MHDVRPPSLRRGRSHPVRSDTAPASTPRSSPF
jgi:hypothetical protein